MNNSASPRSGEEAGEGKEGQFRRQHPKHLARRAAAIVKSRICAVMVAAGAILGLLAGESQARSIYVATTGADANPGTESQPYRTIQKAANVCVAGDEVIIRAGVYRERVVMKTSGTESQPIVFRGERDSNGGWSTSLSGGTAFAGTWVTAPEVGAGCYKTTDIPYNPRCLVADGKYMGRINDTKMGDGTGLTLLGQPTSHTVQTTYLGAQVNFYDTVKAVYGYLNGTTYLRFKDGDDPNTKAFGYSGSTAALTFNGKSHIVVRDLRICDSRYGVMMYGASHHNILENCLIVHGTRRIYLYGGSYSNHIRNNEIRMDFIGYDTPGAWDDGSSNGTAAAELGKKEYLYNFFKYTVGGSQSDDTGIYVTDAGADNEIYGNHIHQGLLGIAATNTADLKIYGNAIHNMSSIGFSVLQGLMDAEFHDNLVYDCNINMRWHNLEGAEARRLYIYRNSFYQPQGISNHIYCHWLSPTVPSPAPPTPEFWVYQNSFAGGRIWMEVSAYYANYGGIPGARFLNNIFSSAKLVAANQTFIQGSGLIGLFDYNWAGGIYHHGLPAWFQSHNVEAENETMWDPVAMPSFFLPQGSAARSAGIDLSQPFSAGGENYDPLPGMRPGEHFAANPDMGAIQWPGDEDFQADWGYRRRLTIEHTSAYSPLKDFPLLVCLADSAIYSQCQANGQDIRFTGADGSTPLPYEIEKWDPNGTSILWVKLPQVDAYTSSQGIYLYYGHSTAPDRQSTAQVWDRHYKGVWHFGEGGTGTGTRYDSSAYANDGTSEGYDGDEGDTGIAGADNLDGTNDSIKVLHDDSLNTPSGLTFEAWIRPDVAASVQQGMIGTKNSGSRFYVKYGYQSGKDNQVTLNVSDGVNPSSYVWSSDEAITVSEWNHVAAVHDGSTLRLYINGTLDQQATTTVALTPNTAMLRLGYSWFDGSLDEIRISDTARSADWLRTQHHSMTNQMVTLGAEETPSP